MVERFRTFLERPLHPSVSRAMLVLAVAVSVGFALVSLLADLGDRPHDERRAVPRSQAPPTAVAIRTPSTWASGTGKVAGQDAQDRLGTMAHREAVREVGGHRALQHVPWHRDGVSIQLIGADAGRAVLAVEGPSIAAARRGWHLFLRRYHDDGRSYLPRIRVAKRGRQ